MSLIQKYIWVIKTIHRSGRITLKDLNEKWRQNIDLSRGENLPRQTFDRWKGGILDMFGIVIDCEQHGKYHYYIANPEVLSEGELRTWLLDTYGTAETLSSSISIHDRILTEEIPSSQDFLATILEAMKSNTVLQMTFQSFTMKEAKTFLVEPYCVKMSAQRWYMLARNVDYNYLRLYSLDRIEGEHHMKCDGCGAIVDKNLRFCTSCGKPLVKPVQAATQAEVPVPPAPLETENSNICPSCGAAIRDNLKFCTACGFSLDDSSKDIYSSSQSKDDPVLNKKKCLSCGALMDNELAFCTECGTPLN